MIPKHTDKPNHTKQTIDNGSVIQQKHNRTMLPLYRYLHPVHYADFTPHL